MAGRAAASCSHQAGRGAEARKTEKASISKSWTIRASGYLLGLMMDEEDWIEADAERVAEALAWEPARTVRAARRPTRPGARAGEAGPRVVPDAAGVAFPPTTEAGTPARHGRSPFSDVAAVPRLQLVT
jgi:hypothetical protein